MYSVGDKFDLKLVSPQVEIFAVYPAGQASLTVDEYEVLIDGVKFRFDSRFMNFAFSKLYPKKFTPSLQELIKEKHEVKVDAVSDEEFDGHCSPKPQRGRPKKSQAPVEDVNPVPEVKEVAPEPAEEVVPEESESEEFVAPVNEDESDELNG